MFSPAGCTNGACQHCVCCLLTCSVTGLPDMPYPPAESNMSPSTTHAAGNEAPCRLGLPFACGGHTQRQLKARSFIPCCPRCSWWGRDPRQPADFPPGIREGGDLGGGNLANPAATFSPPLTRQRGARMAHAASGKAPPAASLILESSPGSAASHSRRA